MQRKVGESFKELVCIVRALKKVNGCSPVRTVHEGESRCVVSPYFAHLFAIFQLFPGHLRRKKLPKRSISSPANRLMFTLLLSSCPTVQLLSHWVKFDLVWFIKIYIFW